MTAADEWFEKGQADVALSRSADYQSELRADLERAVANFDRALAEDPRHQGALKAKGQALAALGDHEGAADAFVAAAQSAPDDVELGRAAAGALQRLGQAEAALGAFEAVLRLAPDDPEALYRRAELLTALGRDELASAAWDAVLRRGETRAVALPGGQAVRVTTGDFRRNEALLGRALALGRLGRADAKLSFLDAFAEVGKGLDGMTPPRALLEALRQVASARDAYREHVALRAAEPYALQRAASTWQAAGRLEEALATWEAVVASAPGDSRAWFGKAEAHAARGELEEAIGCFERSLALEPGFLGARARLKVVRAEAEAKRREG